jgi:DNA invertase Pin-like site-specific DNA recombinase
MTRIKPQVREILKRYAVGGISQRKLAKEYGVNHITIGNIINRKTWSHIQI